MKNILPILCLTLFCLPATAIDFTFKHLNTSRGLPNQQVESVVQDQNGYIWIGTRNGLAKYDGYDIEVYYHNEGHENTLIHNFIHALFIDSKQRLWITTENGVGQYNLRTDKFRNYEYAKGYSTSMVETADGRILIGSSSCLYVYDEKKDSISISPLFRNEYIASLAKDKENRIYVATESNIYVMDAALKNKKPIVSNENKTSDNPDVIMPLFIDSKQQLWIGQNNGDVLRINLKSKERKMFTAAELTGAKVRTITEDKQHRIWMGTENGVLTLCPDGRKIHTQKKNSSNALSDNAIYSILSDRDDNIWIGTYFGGVSYMPQHGSQFTYFQPSSTDGELKARVPRMITETEPGIVWIATEDNGLHIYNTHTNRFNRFEAIPNLDSNIHSIYFDSLRNEMWIGSRFKGLYTYNVKTRKYSQYNHTQGLTSEGIFYILRQKSGKLWVATLDGLRYYDEKTGTFRAIGNKELDHSFVYSLHEDKNNTLWVATANAGLFSIKDGKVKNYCKQNHSGLTDNYVITTLEDSKGRLWIGTNNNGLFWLDKKNDKVRQAGTWMPNQCTICSIVEDRYGTIWIGTDRGLYCHNLNDGRTKYYSAGDELPVNQFNFTSAYLAADGHVIMGTFDGLLYFQPTKMRQTVRKLDVHFKKMYVNNQTATNIEHIDNVTLSYEESHSFYIEYGVIMPENVSDVQYQIRVDDIDKTWRNVGVEHRFYGNLLQPGTYYLRVRANNGNVNWEDCPEKVLKIEIQAPFYRTTMAYIIYALAFVILLSGGLWLYNAKRKRMTEIRFANMEREKLKEIDKMKSDFFTVVSHELKTPLALIMAPLKSINASHLDKNESDSLDIAIRNCSKMEYLINELVTFNKIESDNFPFYVQQGNPVAFVSMAAANFNDAAAAKGLKLVINSVDNDEEGWFSPSYIEHILNNLMSNAMKFTERGGTITINAEIEQQQGSSDIYLKMQVADTGIGIAESEQRNIFERYYQTKRGFNANSSGWGIGLALVHRLAEIHKGSVKVDSEPGKGSTFTVMVNISPNAYGDQEKISHEGELVSAKDYLRRQGTTHPVSSTTEEAIDAPEPSETAGSTILIVEDNDDMRMFLQKLFATDNNVITAVDGQQAWEICNERQDIELVISDVMMPRMTGLELCNMLKDDINTSHIPVILLTAKSDSEDIKTGYRNGADMYIPKPFDPETLKLQTNNLMHLVHSRQEQIVQEGETAIESNDTLTQLDKEFIHSIITLVDENISNVDFSVTDITVKLAMSRSLLHTKMKSLMNISAGEYIRNVRIKKACKMLNEGYNVSETAYACGFSNPNYFSKAFKKVMGISPSDYK